MVIRNESEELFPYSLNTSRPSFCGKDDPEDTTFYKDRIMWYALHTWVKESDVPVAVSGAFSFVDELLEEGRGYMGGGMQYRFWFKTEDDMQAFISEAERLTGKTFTYSDLEVRVAE